MHLLYRPLFYLEQRSSYSCKSDKIYIWLKNEDECRSVEALGNSSDVS